MSKIEYTTFTQKYDMIQLHNKMANKFNVMTLDASSRINITNSSTRNNSGIMTTKDCKGIRTRARSKQDKQGASNSSKALSSYSRSTSESIAQHVTHTMSGSHPPSGTTSFLPTL
jgi:hypothetical protein